MGARLRLAVCFGALIVTIPSVVEAKPIVHEHYGDSFSETFTDDTCGDPITIEHSGEFDGLFMVKPGRHGSDWALVLDNYHTVETYTNTANGATATIVAQGMFKDVHIDVDGNLITFTQIEVGRPITVYGPDGHKLIFDAGRIRFEFTIDTKGTEDPTDDEFFGGEPSVAGPHPVFFGVRDFCDLLDVLR